MMGGRIILNVLKESDVVRYISEIKSVRELVSVKHALNDVAQTNGISNKTVDRALELINEQLKEIDPKEAVKEMLEILF